MNFIKRMNKSIDYIEENIYKNIEIDELCKIVGCSRHYYLRVFPLLIGYSLSDYIRKRKLSLAAQELKSTNISIIDLSIKLGYDSPNSFNHAFKKIHNIAPSKARKKEAIIVYYPKVFLEIKVKGELKMKYRITEKECFEIIGVKKNINYSENIDNNKLIKAWNDITDEIKKDLLEMSDKSFPNLIAVSKNNDLESFDYYIGVPTNHKSEMFEEIKIDKSLWAVFECEKDSPNSISDTWEKIFTEWLPNSEYEYNNIACFEVFNEKDIRDDNCKCEIWVPIINKRDIL